MRHVSDRLPGTMLEESSWQALTNSFKSAVLFENGEREFIFIAAKCQGIR